MIWEMKSTRTRRGTRRPAASRSGGRTGPRFDLAEAIAGSPLRLVELPMARDFLAEYPLLARAAAGELEAWVCPTAAQLARSVPVAATCGRFAIGSFFRLPSHFRAFYISPRPALAGTGALLARLGPGGLAGLKELLSPSRPKEATTRNVIAVKGTEPLAADFGAALARLATQVLSETAPHNRPTERFALGENKVPGALLETEATEEAELAAAFQARHLAAYGCLARAPVPLFIHRLPEDVVQGTARHLRKHVSTRAMRRLEPLLESGLAVYTYHYPTPPLRVSQLPPASCPQRLAALSRFIDVEATIDGWVRHFVRMLYLGYLPAALYSIGDCVDPNNAVVDGGLCDLGSLIAFDELDDRVVFSDTLSYGYFSLNRTVGILLAVGQNRLPNMVLAGYVRDRFTAMLESEARSGLSLDPRVVEYFRPRTFAQTSRLLQLSCD
jgi:hypothetical protein